MAFIKSQVMIMLVIATMTTLAVAQVEPVRAVTGWADPIPVNAPPVDVVNKPLKPVPPIIPPTEPVPIGVVEPPVKDPPVKDPPVKDPPVEDPPVEDPPVKDPPVEDPPVKDPPVKDPPVKDPPDEVPGKKPPLRPVDLKSAGFFTILSKSGISTVPPSSIVGNIGVSPITGKAMTGFSMTTDTSGRFDTSDQITGRAYAADFKVPTPNMMTVSVVDMEAAYTDAASRQLSDGANLNVMGGLISGTTLNPGVYTWGTDINFSSDIYIKGDDKDVFIFQSSGNVIVGSGAKIILVPDVPGGSVPDPANIFWKVAGYLDAGTWSHLEGIFLVKTHAVLKTKASMNGRILAQTACTLDSATVKKPLT